MNQKGKESPDDAIILKIQSNEVSKYQKVQVLESEVRKQRQKMCLNLTKGAVFKL